MTRQKRSIMLVLPVLALALAVLACSGGYSTTSKLSGNSGEVRVKTNSSNGTDSTSVELNDDWSYARVAAVVAFGVESGSCQATLIGGEGTRIAVDASAGSPGQASGDLVTDGFGEITFDSNCQDAQNLDLLINFNLK